VPKPNGGNIITVDEGDLHKILEETERCIDTIDTVIPEVQATQGKLAEDLTDVRGIITDLQSKYRALGDAQTKRGDDSHMWQAETPFHTRAYQNFGKVFWAAWKANKTQYREIPEGYARAADQTGDTDNIGGVLVPDMVIPEIGYILGERSLPRMLATVFPMRSDTEKAPVLTTGPIAYYVGQGNAPSVDSLLEFTGEQMVAKTLMAINIVAGELIEDAVLNFGPFWAQVFADAFALKETKAMFSETASDTNSAFTGIVQAVNAASGGVQHKNYLGGSSTSHMTHFSEVTFDDLIATQYSINENAMDGAVWVMNKAAFRWIAAMTDQQGMPITRTQWGGMLPSPQPRANPSQGRATVILDDPAFISRSMPSDVSTAGKAFVCYGNPKYHFFGTLGSFAIAWSDEAAFTSGARVMRARERYASKTVIVDAFATLSTAAS
jgi:HK97 family phage major capsid protein